MKVNSIQSKGPNQEEDDEKSLLSLPKVRGWRTPHLYFFQNFWCQPKEIQAIISCQTHFQARDSDVIVATIPKSGTTWLKALTFGATNRTDTQPLLTSNPHDLVPFLEYSIYANNNLPQLSDLPSPRLFATHVPFSALPESIKNSGCRVVYLCRNPLDTFVSSWHFINKSRPQVQGGLSIEEAFDMYCRGLVGFGPHWDHMLGYWKESRERPEKVLFLQYEDMKEKAGFYLRRLAEFLGRPFSADEEREGVELEVNKTGRAIPGFENASLFRKGEVGDWANHLTPPMVERLTKIMEEKLEGSGLTFKVFGK
ncbi:hypothetical protein NMG60_11029633 [Bertholletia excelsa]